MLTSRREFLEIAGIGIGYTLASSNAYSWLTTDAKIVKIAYNSDGPETHLIGLGATGEEVIKKLLSPLNGDIESSAKVWVKVICERADWLIILADNTLDSMIHAEEIAATYRKKNPKILITMLCSTCDELKPPSLEFPGTVILVPQKLCSFNEDPSMVIAAKYMLRTVCEQFLIGVDFADVKTVLNSAKVAIAITGEGKGKDRAVMATEEAIYKLHINGVDTIKTNACLFAMCSDLRNTSMYQAQSATNRILTNMPDDNIIYSYHKESLSDSFRVLMVVGIS